MPNVGTPGSAKKRPRSGRSAGRFRKKLFKRRLQVGKPLTPVVHRFKRTVVQTIALGATPPSGWQSDGSVGIYKQWFFQLNDLPDHTDFTNLFTQYKITGVATKMYFSTTVSGVNQDTAATTLPAYQNSQILMRCVPARSGEVLAVTDDNLNQQQCVMRRLCINSMGKPVSIYTKLKPCRIVTGKHRINI